MVKIEKFTEEDMQKDPMEFFGTIPMDEIVDMKDAPYEDKIRFMKYCMGFKDLVNTPIITNITLLIYGTRIDDDAFEDPRIIFSSLEEYVDAKYDLKEEINEYSGDIVKFYFGSLRSYSVILPDGKISIPGSYKAILIASTTKDISKLMNHADWDRNDIPLVFDADVIMDSFIFSDSKPVQDFVAMIMDGLKHDANE